MGKASEMQKHQARPLKNELKKANSRVYLRENGEFADTI